MTNHEKNEIKILLDQYCKQYPSQSKAAASFKNVSEATVIQIRKNNWDRISEEMWRNVAKQVGYKGKSGEWKVAQTRPFNILVQLLEDAQDYAVTHAVIASAGSCKTFTSTWYEKNRKNVFHLECGKHLTPKYFLEKLIMKMGKKPFGSVNVLLDTLIETIIKLETPVIILDEVDKLKNETFVFIITFCNMLRDKCGLALLATENLQNKIIRNLHKEGYEEIYSRIGRRFITIPSNDKNDVTAVCEANGVTDPATIMAIYNDCEKDLRRVEKLIHRTHRQRDKEIRLETA